MKRDILRVLTANLEPFKSSQNIVSNEYDPTLPATSYPRCRRPIAVLQTILV